MRLDMGRLDEVDLSLKLSRKEQDKRLEAAWDRLSALRLQLGGLIGDGRLTDDQRGNGFKPAIMVPDDAPVQDKLLGYVGRQT